MNDKKKALILGALVVVMLGIGAFQFTMGGKSAPPAEDVAKSDKKDAATAAAGAEGTVEKTEIGPDGKPVLGPDGKPVVVKVVDPALQGLAILSPRDPFDGTAWGAETTGKVAATATAGGGPMAPPTGMGAPVTNPEPPAPRGRRAVNRDIQIPPVNPGEILAEGNGQLPDARGNLGGGNLAAGAPGNNNFPDIRTVPYEVSGVIRGRRQAAVFRDSSGNERLVKVGQKLDGDTEVIAVMRGQVKVRHRGEVKTLKLSQDATSNGKDSKSGEKEPNIP
jgi:hypothetical protein